MTEENNTDRTDVIKKNNVILNADNDALAGYKKQKQFNRRIDLMEKRIEILEKLLQEKLNG